MNIIPIACESLGTRSFCHFVETDDLTILIDPSVSLAPKRFGKRPHPLEIATAWISRQLILKAALKADVVIQTHYHADHFTLNKQRVYEFTDKTVFDQIYHKNTIIFAKDIEMNLNYNQQKRAQNLWKRTKQGYNIQIAENNSYKEGNTKITFSKPIRHGIDEKRGYIFETVIEDAEMSYLYTSDVCGPVTKEATNFILENRPDIITIDGPSIYHPNVDNKEKELAYSNLRKIVKIVPEVYIDHHFLRTLHWKKELEENVNAEIKAFSEIRGEEPLLLEAQRKDLHNKESVNESFYKKLQNKQELEKEFDKIFQDYNLDRYWRGIERDFFKERE